MEQIIVNVELSDEEINFAQELLKLQFPKLNGLQSSLFQEKPLALIEDAVKNKIQIILVLYQLPHFESVPISDYFKFQIADISVRY